MNLLMSVPELLSAVNANFRKLKLAGIDLNFDSRKYEEVLTYRFKLQTSEVSHVSQLSTNFNVVAINVYETEQGAFILGESSELPSVLRTIVVATHEFLHIALRHARRSETIHKLHPYLNYDRLMQLLTVLEHVELTRVQLICTPSLTNYFTRAPTELFNRAQAKVVEGAVSLEAGFEEFLHKYPSWFEGEDDDLQSYRCKPRKLLESSTEDQESIPVDEAPAELDQMLVKAMSGVLPDIVDRVHDVAQVLKGMNTRNVKWSINTSPKYKDIGYLKRTSLVWSGDVAIDTSGSMSDTFTINGEITSLLSVAMSLVGILENVEEYHTFNIDMQTHNKLPTELKPSGGTDFELLNKLADTTIVITDAQGDISHLERFALVIVIGNPDAKANNFYHI